MMEKGLVYIRSLDSRLAHVHAAYAFIHQSNKERPDLGAHLLGRLQTSPAHSRGAEHTAETGDGSAEGDGGVQSNDQMVQFSPQSHEAGRTVLHPFYR